MPADIAFLASSAPDAQAALAELTTQYGTCPLDSAQVIVALGGDGFMLQTLHADRKSTRLNSSHTRPSRMPSSA